MKSYTLTLTTAQLDVIAAALTVRPYGEVAPVVNEISRQVQAQENPAPPQAVSDEAA